jgi:alkylhydroperoxidase family enzyme
VLTDGLVEPELKRLCFRFVAEEDVMPETERERLALRWAQAIGWDSDLADDELWAALHAEFSEPELVELGCAIGFALGQQHFERTLGLEPHAGLS